MEKTNPEPEGWVKKKGHDLTLIKTQSNSGNYWPVRLKHNGSEYLIPRQGLNLHINGGAVYVNGIDITRKVQKGVENIFRHDVRTGRINNITRE